MIIIKVNTKC